MTGKNEMDGVVASDQKRKRSNRGWENLRPAKPGETRNPRGRPPGKRYLSEAMRGILGSHPDALQDDPMTVADGIAAAIAKKALKGSVSAAELLGDRSEGKAGVQGGGAVGLVGMMLLLPDRATALDELPAALAASETAVRAALLADAGAGLPALGASDETLDAEVVAPDEGPEDGSAE